MYKLKKLFRIKTKPELELENCICHTCEFYYDVYEAKTAITDRIGNENKMFKYLCYCAANTIGLPFFSDKTGKLCPDVVSCGTYKKLKKPRIPKK